MNKLSQAEPTLCFSGAFFALILSTCQNFFIQSKSITNSFAQKYKYIFPRIYMKCLKRWSGRQVILTEVTIYDGINV